MDPHSKAIAIAELDAICDEFEQLFQADRSLLLSEETAFLDPWLQRVSSEWRPWLKEELIALRQDLQSANWVESTSQRPDGVGHDIWQAVTDCQTFHALSLDAIRALAKSIRPRHFASGTTLLESGQRASGLYLITEGYVDVVGADGNDRHLIAEDGAGSVLGEMSLITGHPCAADVIATSDVQALVLPVEEFASLRQQHPEIEIALSQLVSDRLGHRCRDALCGKSLGGYRLERCLSSGAMGVVYRAVEESNGSQRALKMLRHRFIYSPRVVSRFDQEADLLRKLKHPNIVSMREHFIAYRTRFIVLDLYDGADLRQVVRRLGPLPEPTARALLGQIAAGLAYAHQQGVLHLDLKPANILINRQGHVAITDFGLSRLMESDGADLESVGTPLYMPPEQFTMTGVGPHCDWYAFGCIAYELITGERLFNSNDTKELRASKRRYPSPTWPEADVSQAYRRHLTTSLQPLARKRDLDLEEIASWAQPVRELAAGFGKPR